MQELPGSILLFYLMIEQFEHPDWLYYRHDNWRGIVRQGWEELLGDPGSLGKQGQSVNDKPDRMVRRWESPLGNVYIKHIYSPNSFSERLLTYAKNRLRPPRSLQVWHISEALLEEGLRCPKPLLGAFNYSLFGLDSEEFLVSAEIAHPLLNKRLNNSSSAAEIAELLAAAGKSIRLLHDKGFVHGDCLPGNMCIDPENNLYFLDNDRTARLSLLGARRERLRNLVQFASRALPLLPDNTTIDDFVQAYYLQDQRRNAIIEKEQQEFMRMLELRLRQLEREIGRKLPTLK